MFIPVEPAFGLAAGHGINLFDEAFAKNIIISSPSTLLAVLRTVAAIWKQEKQNRNAMEIARQSGDLYDKFVSFIKDLNDVGMRLNQTHESYDEAIKKLRTGRGSIVGQIERIKKLGADTTKALPQELIDYTAETEELKFISPHETNTAS